MFSNVLQLSLRIESALIYTIVRFLYALLKRSLDMDVIAYLNIVVAFMAYNIRMLLRSGSYELSVERSIEYICKIFQKFATLISTQAIIQSLQPQDLETASAKAQIECLCVSLCVLVLLTLLPGSFKESEDGTQFMRLVLFMFTSNTEFIIQRVSFGWTLPFLSMAGFVVMYNLSKYDGGRWSEINTVISKAFTLSLTNMMILSSWTVNVHSSDSSPQLTQLVSLLVLFDAISVVFDQFSAMRDYAVWQGASQVYNMVVLQNINQTAMIMVSGLLILVLRAASSFFPSSSAITELSVLIIINIVLGMIQKVVNTLHANDTMIVVMLWIMVIEILTTAMRSVMK